MLATQQPQSGTIFSRPATFVATGGSGLPLVFSSSHQGNSLIDTSSMPFDALRDNFGMLLGKPKNGICAEATTEEEFMCHMDIYAAYKGREWPIFGNWVTAQLLNARNRFLPGIISPILETPEINFQVNQTSISAMPFTEIAPCGIPEEPSGSYTYSWKETVREYAQGCTVNRDLVLDPNFGAQIWMQMLQSFVSNARLTIDMGIMVTLVQTGYENMSRARTEGCPVDPHKRWLNESEGFFIMAIDPERGITLVRNSENEIPDWDTLILPQGKINYIRDVAGDSMSMYVQKLSTDPVTRGIIVDFIEGPDSFKSIKLGNRIINVIEFTPFYIGDPGRDGKGGIRANPLATNVTIGQFYPPSPFTKLGINCDEPANCNINSIFIFHQTKTIGAQVEITLAERLTNAIYWDKKTGKVSRQAQDFARIQSQRRKSPEQHPWDWNEQNRDYDHQSNINRETTSNSEPNLSELANETSVRAMVSYRQNFVGLTWDPRVREFKVPVRFGDFHLRSIPNEYVHMAAQRLESKFFEKYGYRLEDGIARAKRLASSIRNTQVTDAYVFSLLDKNLPTMIAVTPKGNGGNREYRLVPVRTPLIRPDKGAKSNKNPKDQCKFPEAEVIEEAKSNRFGGWDVPDKSAAIPQVYPPLFANGVQIMTLAQEGLKEGISLWFAAGKEALEVVTFAEQFLKFLREFVGKTDLINPRFMGPWIHKPSALARLIDVIIGAAGPVHVGLPGTINYTVDAPDLVPTQKANLLADQVILQETVAETRLWLENAIAGNERIAVDNETRALACLSNEVYQNMRTITRLIESMTVNYDVVKAGLISTLHQLYDYLINLCGTSKNADSHKTSVEASSLIAGAFFAQMNTFIGQIPADMTETDRANFLTNTVLTKMRTFAASLKSTSAVKKILKDARDQRPLVCVDYGDGYLMALREYEKPPVRGRDINVERGTGAFPNITPAPIYRADYRNAPARYIRAPLASSQSLRDYLRDKLTPWVLPSDANLFYARAEEPRIVTGDSTIETSVHKNKFELCSLARSLVFQCRLAARNSSGRQQQQQQASNDMDEDLFESLSSKKPVSMNKIFSLGKNWESQQEQDDPYYGLSEMRSKSRAQYASRDSGEIDINSVMEEEYFGPWKARLAYRAKEITSSAQKFLFSAIIQSKNRLETPVKMAAAGAVIIDAMLVRPFIEVRTSAMIAMKAGSETMITTIGHSHVQVTKESRGCWHVDVGFFMGVIKIQPNNIKLIPHAFPESLIGGKGVNFMTNFNDLRLPNPAKPSMISVLLGPDEREFDSPLHISNGETMIRPSVDYALHQRKHSSWQWLDHLFGQNTLANIDINSMGRDTYASCVSASNVLSQGPASYINPSTGCKEDVEGNGPMGTFNLNMPGVQDVYEGQSQRFPDRIQLYAYQNSCVQKK